jgi:hypothetical protein
VDDRSATRSIRRARTSAVEIVATVRLIDIVNRAIPSCTNTAGNARANRSIRAGSSVSSYPRLGGVDARANHAMPAIPKTSIAKPAARVEVCMDQGSRARVTAPLRGRRNQASLARRR